MVPDHSRASALEILEQLDVLADMAGGAPQEKKKKDEKLPENSKKNLDKKLDHALEETFPTSDPISVKITK